MAEWSKAVSSSLIIFGCVGSNPTGYNKTHVAQLVSVNNAEAVGSSPTMSNVVR